MASGEQIILASNSYRPDAVFYRVVIDIQLSISGIDH